MAGPLIQKSEMPSMVMAKDTVSMIEMVVSTGAKAANMTEKAEANTKNNTRMGILIRTVCCSLTSVLSGSLH